MECTDRSLLAAGATSLKGEATSRKRKQSHGGADSTSPTRRRPSMLRYQESGSCSSMLTTLGDASQGVKEYSRLYQGDDTSAGCESGNSRIPPELHSVPSGDTSQGGSALASGALAEGRMYDQFKPFETKSPSPGHSLGDGAVAASAAAAIDAQGCLPGDATQGFRSSWQKHDWNSTKQDARLRGSFEPGSESVGGRSSGTGASGVTKQGDSASGSGSAVFRQGSSRDQFQPNFEVTRRRSQEWNSKRTASGSVSGVTKDRGVWGSSAGDEKDDAEDDGDAQSGEHQQYTASPELSLPPDTLQRAAATENVPILPVASTIPIVAREKRGRSEFDQGGEERVVKTVRVEGVRVDLRRVALPALAGGSGCSSSPDSVLGECRDLPPQRLGTAAASAGSRQATPSPEACGKPDTRPAIDCVDTEGGVAGVGDRAGQASVSQAGDQAGASAAGGEMPEKTWGMRDPGPSHTGMKERLSDSFADLADVESSGRLSGYDPETSVSDTQDGDGSLFVLSSGRTRRRRQGGPAAPRQPTIDDEFEQYFSQMLL